MRNFLAENPAIAEIRAEEGASGQADIVRFDLVWTTGADVERTDWRTLKPYVERLEVSEKAIDLSRLNSGAPVLRDHWSDTREVIGVVERAWIDTQASPPCGRATVRLSQRADVAPVIQDIRDGILRNVSVGYKIRGCKVQKRDGQPDIRVATRWEPAEISVVAVGADPAAGFNRSSEDEDFDMDNQETRDGATEAAPTKTDQLDMRSVEELTRKAMETERKRMADIASLCRRHGADHLEEALFSTGVTVDAARAAILDEIAKRAPTIKPNARAEILRDEMDTVRGALDKAVQLRFSNGELAQDDHELTKSFRHASFTDVAREILEARGERVKGMSAYEIIGRAMESTSDFSNLLGSNVNRQLLAAYSLQPQTYGPLVQNDTVRDFRTIEMHRLGSIGTPTQLVEGGEIKYVALSDSDKETAALLTYAQGIKVTRNLLVNDDLGGIRRLINGQGEAINRLEGNLAWAQITGNPTMGDGVALFNSAHGNLDGSGAALSNTSLGAARLALRTQTEPNGLDYLNLQMTHLVIPPELETAANSLLRNAFVSATTANTIEAFFRGLPIIVEPRLSASDTNAWYAASVGANAPIMRYTLAGASRPVTQSEVEFGTGNLKVAVRHDVAFKVVDWRTLYKNVGA